jgi:hypothetical protein
MLMWVIAGGAVLLIVFTVMCGVTESKVGSFQWRRMKRYDSDKAQFRKINGRVVRSVGVKHASHLEFRYSVACEAGRLSVTILDSAGTRTPLFSGEQVQDSGTQVLAVTPGSKYKLEIKGEQAKGTYELSWAPVTV